MCVDRRDLLHWPATVRLAGRCRRRGNVRGSFAESVGVGFGGTRFAICDATGARWNVSALLDRSDQRDFGRVFASGVSFGIGVLMKQPAAVFILFGGASILCNDIRRRATFRTIVLRISIFSAGAITPFGFTCLILWQAGVFEKFWFWTVNYAADMALAFHFVQLLRFLR